MQLWDQETDMTKTSTNKNKGLPEGSWSSKRESKQSSSAKECHIIWESWQQLVVDIQIESSTFCCLAHWDRFHEILSLKELLLLS